MKVSIRLAKTEDKEEIIDLQTESLRVLCAKDYQAPKIESLVREQAKFRFNKEAVFVAIYNEKIVGFSSINVETSEIYGLFISPKFTRQGIGTRLLETLEKIALRKKHKFIYVTSSLTAKIFYSKRGYQVVRASGFYSEQKFWINTVLMQKKLIISGTKMVIFAIYLLAIKKIYQPIFILLQDYRLISLTRVARENKTIIKFVNFLIIIMVIAIVLSLI
ncbi:MAG: GNAT family N-acetyltransferase [Trichodesmium sp.]